MNPPNQFGSAKPQKGTAGMSCAQCEAMLPDWMDHAEGGELTAEDRAAFDLHIATCAECSQMLADAQRGADLLQMLKSPRPEPSCALLDRILANTSGVAGTAKSRPSNLISLSAIDGAAVEIQSVNPANYPMPVEPARPAVGVRVGNVLPFRPAAASRFSLRAITHTMMQPRLAMTAAMAFFSIALTLNLTGVKLNQLSVSDLKPSNLRRTFYQADASVARYYDNLRVVYELESKVQDMKRSNDASENDGSGSSDTKSDSDPSTDRSKQNPQRKTAPKAGSGTSDRRTPSQQRFVLAEARETNDRAGHPPRSGSPAPSLLTSLLDRQTVTHTSTLKATAETNKLKEQKGVLA